MAACGVLVAEGAGEEEVIAGDGLVGPAVGVANDVMVATHRPEVAAAGGAGLAPGYPVVEVAVDRWHATSGVDTGGMQHLGFAALRHCGASSSDATVDGLFGVGVVQHPTTFNMFLMFSDLSGHICNDWPEPAQLSGFF